MLPLSSTRASLQAATLGLLVLLLGGVALGCSPPVGDYTEPTLEERVDMSELVFYGVPLAHYRAERLGKDAYTAKMNIFCVLKGPKMPLEFNVTGAGWSFFTKSSFIHIKASRFSLPVWVSST